MPRRWTVRGAWIAGLIVLATAGGWTFDAWRRQEALGQARREVARGDYSEARARLVRFPGRGEADYLLGVCEEALGRHDAALAAWARVDARSRFAGPSAIRRAHLAIDRGRLADAEEALTRALRLPSADRVNVRLQLARLLWREGRVAETPSLLESNWRDLEREGRLTRSDALELLRGHLAVDLEAFPLEEAAAFLDRAERLAPEDDRVRLARARWAIATGRLSAAREAIDECLRRRPEDPAVWRARLDLGRAAGRVHEVRQALGHLQASGFSEGDRLELRAWLAAQRVDADQERQALERLVAVDPGRLAPLARLADLETRAGHPERANELRQRKAALDRARQRYRTLFKDDDLESSAEEMAGLAETLSRRFEARAFLTLLQRRAPDDDALRTRLARASDSTGSPRPVNGTIAELLEPETGDGPGASPPPSAERSSRPPPRFEDIAGPSRLSAFVFQSGATPQRQLPEVMSGGIGLLDFDGDGRLDVYAVQGGRFPPPSRRVLLGDRLFRNRGDGTFEDVTRRSGLAGLGGGYGHGVAVGDVDNDGRPDLFVTRWRSYALYRNRGDGTFEDVTEHAGLAGDRDWPTSAAFADLDGDGDLDLYVCHYLQWDAEHPRLCTDPRSKRPLSCDPRHFEAMSDHVFRNDKGRFVDVTAEAGIVDRDGRGLGVVAADLDDDGRVDLFVANDGSANYFFRNLGGFRFEESALTAGLAGNAEGGFQAGMGVACGDLDGDGRIDLAVTNFYGESTTYFQNLGGGVFADRTAAVGLSAPTRGLLGFGAAFLDADDDGRLDLLTANGHVNDLRPETAHAMPLQLLQGVGSRLVDVSERAGAPFRIPHVGRGLAVGDLDGDGRLDALAVAQDAPLVVLRNATEGGRSITLRLEGAPSNRDAVGARVTLSAGGRRQVAQRFGGGSYLSSGDPRLHFGLGDSRRADEVEVRWPSGRVDRFRDLEAGRGYLLREGETRARPLSPAPRR